ncbi:MAG: ATPase [Alphaproteobacteria bacterium CG_4_10_14_0_2_um_filter_63_37]|nr:MAG: ATPase [Proteobacteria bacterium CG1_02_64_396]PJA25376.1 MAG: ATPase [Alphaproteobacteria bacterium CG_4_10_14_0_2_um_filter_63_37]
MTPHILPPSPWSQSETQLRHTWQIDPLQGLDGEVVRQRLHRFGPNRLREVRRRTVWEILRAQFESLMVLFLVVAAGLAFAFDETVEGIAIGAVILLSVAIGFVMEVRATRSMEALHRLGVASVRVRRSGQEVEIPADRLVPGDVVLVEGGDVLTADLRWIEAARLQIDESPLTGESLPVSKTTLPLPETTPLSERSNMGFKGTAVLLGSGVGLVVATGMATELGKISALMQETDGRATPLELRLEEMGRRLIGATLAIAALVAVSGWLAGKDLFLMVETAIALAVAAIPEGLPVVATMALARGMWRMAGRNALIRRLSAVETLGSATLICTDKTGTLTENRMTVTVVMPPSGEAHVAPNGLLRGGELIGSDPDLTRLLEAVVLCNNASLGGKPGGAVGDPLEVALLEVGLTRGIERKALLQQWPELREEAFDPEARMMATLHQVGAGMRIAVKGAPESVLAACLSWHGEGGQTPGGQAPFGDHERQMWLSHNRAMAAAGLRVLAVAERFDGQGHPFADLTFLGLIGLLDPPRRDVREAIDTCQAAGIRVVMITGDQPETARSIALATGLVDDPATPVILGSELGSGGQWSAASRLAIQSASILARVTPAQKLNLVRLHQDCGEVVAMTGDGVNDAPALRQADIGIAMGRRGTQVAREAADMVLADDAFSTIVHAVAQGRIIFGNIRKFVLYLMSCNVAEIMVVALPSLLGAPLPLLPLQILFLNLVTDVFPALALGMGEGDPGAMNHPPRNPKEPLLTRHHWWLIAGYGAVMAAAVLGAFALALGPLGLSAGQGVTVSFLTVALAQLLHVFNMRDRGSTWWRNDIVANGWVWGALALCVLLLGLATYGPLLPGVLGLEPIPLDAWGVVIGMSVLPLLVGQVGLGGRGRRD